MPQGRGRPGGRPAEHLCPFFSGGRFLPSYRYEALGSGGQKSSGILQADSPRDARRLLRQQNLHVTELASATFVQRRGAKLLRARRFSRSKAMHVEAVTRQLALLLENEIKLTDALNITMEEVGDKKILAALRDIRDRVANGSSVAEAMEPHEWIFSHMYVSMVRVGETAGTLPEVLRRMADHLRERTVRQGQLSAVLIYPVVMMLFAVAVVIFVSTSVLPKIKGLLDTFGSDLPLPTEMLMTTYGFFRDYYLLVGLVGAGALIAVVSLLKTQKGRRLKDAWMLRTPVVGDLVRKQQTVQFTSTLRTLLESGVKMADSMAVLLETSNNTFMRDTVADLQESIVRGSDVSTVLRRSRVIPKAVAHMVAVGEQSGELEQVLGRMSANLNAEVEITVARLNALLQPVIIIGMAFVVGFIVAAVMFPILRMGAFENIR